MQKTAKLLILPLFICLVFAFSSREGLAQTNKQSAIIYEYEVITQKKEQSLGVALKVVNLSAHQSSLIKKLPVTAVAKSERTFRLLYQVKDGKRLLREVKVSRAGHQLNYVLKKASEKYEWIKKTSNISLSEQKEIDYWSAIVWTQKKGKNLAEIEKFIHLNSLQKKIFQTGKFSKKVKSNRVFTFYFEGNDSLRLFRALSVKDKHSYAAYVVKKQGLAFSLINLKKLKPKDRYEIEKYLSSARKVSAKPIGLVTSTNTQTKTSVKLTGTEKTPLTSIKKPISAVKVTAKISAKTSAKTPKPIIMSAKTPKTVDYEVLTVTQKKGVSLEDAYAALKLTGLQKKLISQLPVIPSAKSTRKLHFLFEKEGNKKYLRAARIARAGAVAEFVLIRYKGQWVWGNKQGEISLPASNNGFMRFPLHYSRISSGFNLRRRHPITKKIRPHKGTDFKAAYGVKIWVPADGVVTFAGRQRGYGNIIIIDHQNGYKTKYAHLARILKGARKGKRVKRKQIIGLVGSTGLSTGSHLHYEVLVNGKAHDPMKVKLPKGKATKSRVIATQVKKKFNNYLPMLRALSG